MTSRALTTAICAPARLAAGVQSEPWGVLEPGCFQGLSSLRGPVWVQKQGLLALDFGVN